MSWPSNAAKEGLKGARVAFHQSRRHGIACYTCRERDTVADLVDALEHQFTHIGREPAQVQLEHRGLGDDVVVASGLDRSHGQDRRCLRVHVAADDRLVGEDGLGRHHDRIDRHLRSRSMPTHAVKRDIELIYAGHAHARRTQHHAYR